MDANVNLLLSQWQNSPQLKAVIQSFLDLAESHIQQPLAALANQRRIDTASGVWLDYIGGRLGVSRPLVTDSTVFARLGFTPAGVGFRQARFAGASPVSEPKVDLGDPAYRRLLRARAIYDLAYSDTLAVSLAAVEIDSAAVVTDNLDLTATIETNEVFLMQIALDAKAIPVPAGVLVTVTER